MKKRNYVLIAIVAIAFLGFAENANAYTAQEIVNSVIAELDNVTDYSATVDCDFANPDTSDMTDGSFQWKRNSGTWKSKMTAGSPYTNVYICDGTGWNFMESSTEGIYYSKTKGDELIRGKFGTDLFNMENVLSSETWDKDPNTATVNSVECYRVYTTKSNGNYEVWIDTASMTKVIRVKATDVNDNLQWQIDYSNYSFVENTAQLPTTIGVTRKLQGSFWYSAIYNVSDININENLSDNIFDLNFTL